MPGAWVAGEESFVDRGERHYLPGKGNMGFPVRRRGLDDLTVPLGQEIPGVGRDAFPPRTRNLVALGIAWHGNMPCGTEIRLVACRSLI